MRRWILFYVMILLAPGCSCTSGPPPLGFKLDVEVQTLSNGLTVITSEDHTVPIVSYQTWYRVGSVDEDLGATGLAHLLEHLMFKGTEQFGPKSFFNELESKGAEVNAFTTRDYTVYYQNFTPNLLGKVIELEADRMVNLKLTEEGLTVEKQVVFEERRLRTENSPAGRMSEALWQLAFKRHPYQWPVIGYHSDLVRLDVKTLQDFYKKYYQPSNAAIVVVGDFNTEKLIEQIEKAYGDLESKRLPGRQFGMEPEQKEERRYRMYDHVVSERFMWAYHVSRAANDDSYSLDVLSNILFHGSSSRAHRKLVEEDQISTGVSGSNYTPTFPGLFTMSVVMKPGVSHEQGEKVLARLVGEFQEKPVTEEEIRIAAKQLIVQLVDGIQTPHGLAQTVGTVHTILGDALRFNDDINKYNEVTPESVMRVAKKYLHPNNRATVVMQPKEMEIKK